MKRIPEKEPQGQHADTDAAVPEWIRQMSARDLCDVLIRATGRRFARWQAEQAASALESAEKDAA